MSRTAEALLSLQQAAKSIRQGVEPGSGDRYNLTLVRTYCDAILDGESVEPDQIYLKAFNGKLVTPENIE